jgi:hypothetical protein
MYGGVVVEGQFGKQMEQTSKIDQKVWVRGVW